MERSLTSFEITESTLKNGSDSGSDKGSDKGAASSENIIDTWALPDTDSPNGNSDEDFDNNLPETVTLYKLPETGAKLYLVGTAHFSKESQQDVQNVIQHVKPNVVVLELCESRTNILTLDEQTILEEAKNVNFQKILHAIRTSGVVDGIMYLLLLDISAHITKETGMAPGGEFRVAFREAAKIPNCGVHLGDRPFGITLKRALAKLSWFQMFQLIWHLVNAKGPVSTEEIERCKNRDMLEQLLAEFAGEYPGFGEVFLDERDTFLAYSLQKALVMKPKRNKDEAEPPKEEAGPVKVVGVVGIGHVPGILKRLPFDQKPFIANIVKVPPPSKISKFIRISLRLSTYALGGYLIYRFVPVPRYLKQNFNVIFHSMLSSITTNKGTFNYRSRF